jgi:hypothetical protein
MMKQMNYIYFEGGCGISFAPQGFYSNGVIMELGWFLVSILRWWLW